MFGVVDYVYLFGIVPENVVGHDRFILTSLRGFSMLSFGQPAIPVALVHHLLCHSDRMVVLIHIDKNISGTVSGVCLLLDYPVMVFICYPSLCLPYDPLHLEFVSLH
jgi:hypothetical protein